MEMKTNFYLSLRERKTKLSFPDRTLKSGDLPDDLCINFKLIFSPPENIESPVLLDVFFFYAPRKNLRISWLKLMGPIRMWGCYDNACRDGMSGG